VLLLPVVLKVSALSPRAVLESPVVLLKSAEAEGSVVAADGVELDRTVSEGDVASTASVALECEGAYGGVLDTGHSQIAGILAKKGVARTEVVHEELTAFEDVTSGSRGIWERQVANDVIRARWALWPGWPLRPRLTLRPLQSL
jgi:hypothetical protein